MLPLIPVPDHVSKDVVYDFDIHANGPRGELPHSHLAKLHENAPDVFYTLRNGGHWVITRYEQIAKVVEDPEHFSVREMQIPRVAHPPVLIPLSLDPPDNIPFRQILMPSFSPKSIKELEEKIRHWAAEIIGDIADKGECDFVHDVSALYPVSIFMELMGMDMSRRREFRTVADNYFGSLNNESDMMKYTDQIIGIMTEYIEEKTKNPDEGLISHMIKAQVNGRPIRLDELQNMCTLLFQGGLHTVTNQAAFTFGQLAKMPELQERLAREPELIPQFVEEAARIFGVSNTPRIVRKDCEKFGVKFKEGDMVLCMLTIGGRDERVNENPNNFDIDRKKRETLLFSRGPHLCVGHFLARAEIRILTEEWLKRIPRFSVKPGAEIHYETSVVVGIKNLPLTWTL